MDHRRGRGQLALAVPRTLGEPVDQTDELVVRRGHRPDFLGGSAEVVDHGPRPVDHDVLHLWVIEVALQRARFEQGVQHRLPQLLQLGGSERFGALGVCHRPGRTRLETRAAARSLWSDSVSSGSFASASTMSVDTASCSARTTDHSTGRTPGTAPSSGRSAGPAAGADRTLPAEGATGCGAGG
ncbi:hypothetical protein OG897_31240 [Streptomyces sp. NBC_00237]|uniref:hypothetical protein n=1 Tax=Streptomyces sp. NBC_00237 TaxID=2975687 RepID=UPI00224F8DFF|nr:hypothetical protein [Streptomyces sp. NBC_00237]MCX5205892.1 hypothetical protein [Streptomyces sp. NBC_00237]